MSKFRAELFVYFYRPKFWSEIVKNKIATNPHFKLSFQRVKFQDDCVLVLFLLPEFLP